MALVTGRNLRRLSFGCLLLALFVAMTQVEAAEERVKDLASIAGVRTNQLIGYGLVIGLDGTGDQTTQAPFTAQSLRNMLGQLGVTIPQTMLISVVVPAPFGPRRAKISPLRISRSMRFSACRPEA